MIFVQKTEKYEYKYNKNMGLYLHVTNYSEAVFIFISDSSDILHCRSEDGTVTYRLFGTRDCCGGKCHRK